MNLYLLNGIINLPVNIVHAADDLIASKLQTAGYFDGLQRIGAYLVDLGNALVAWTMMLPCQKAAGDALRGQHALVAIDDAIAY